MVDHDHAEVSSIFKTARPVLNPQEGVDKPEGEVQMDIQMSPVHSQDLNAIQRFFVNIFGGHKAKRQALTQGQPQTGEAPGKLHNADAFSVPEANVAAMTDSSGKIFPPPLPSPQKIDEFDAASLADFHLRRVLGKGSFGKVFLVEKVQSGDVFAMKVLKKSKLKRPKQIQRTRTERRVLEVSRGNNFTMSLHYAFQTKDKLYIVLDYCQGGELFFHLSRFRKFPEQVACFYAAELTCALAFLHEHGIIYRDMKPENVLLDVEGHVQLGDFGLAKDNIWHPSYGARSICGTPEYMAPEVLDKVGHGSAVDWWGLGMLLYEMLTGLPPWYTKDRQKLFQRLRFAPLHIPVSMSSKCASVVRSLLIRDPNERLGAQNINDIKNHPFFTDNPNFSWKELECLGLRPPINPMQGLDANAGVTDTSNFDPQFTRMSIESDGEDPKEETYEHFENFEFSRSVCDDATACVSTSGVEPDSLTGDSCDGGAGDEYTKYYEGQVDDQLTASRGGS